MRSVPKQRVSEVTPVPAPVGGIDDTSSVAAMDSKFAIEMINYYPESGALKVRWGYSEHVTGLPSPGKTLMVFNKQDGTSKLFCATDDGIYDVTVSTSTPTLVKAITNGDMIWTTFSNIAGQWLIACNGTDAPVFYDGTSWGSFSNVAVPANPGEITNGTLPVASISFVHQHKNRLWFIEKSTMSAWYLPLNAISGAATEFPMGGIFKKGGSLTTLFSWTMDAGYSVDDIFIMQSSQGEIAGYGGTDPDTVGTWWLEARHFIGKPLGNRSNVALNGDNLLLTEYGITPISKIVGGQYQLGATDATASGRISRTLNSLVRTRSGAPGWELTNSPAFQYIVLSVPESSGYMPFQFVMNSITGAWCIFDLPAVTFREYGQTLYFTDENNRVLAYGNITVDNVMLDGSGGTPIIASFQQAYNYFNKQTVSKHFKLVKAIFESTSAPSYLLTVSADFEPGGVSLLGTPGVSTSTASQWDVAKWDEDLWSPPLTAWQEWVGVAALGYSGSLIVRTRTTVDTRFVASHWAYELGVSL